MTCALLCSRLIAMLFVAGLVAMVPLAHASPPDPTWIAGLYDDGDHDTAVTALSDACGLPANEAAAISPATLATTRVTIGIPARSHTRSPLGPVDRAPPRP